MIYTKDFAFIHIPKTSGTSIKKSIAKNCLDAKYMPEDMFSETINGIDWRQVMHYPYSHWESLIEDRWVFSMVRNPYIRAVSLFVFLKNLYKHKDKNVDFTFEELYTHRDRKNLYIPTLTQTQHLTGTKGLISNIYKYEEGYSAIEKKLGFKIDQKEMVNPKYNYLDYYNEEREKLIYNLFEEDFENFSYSSNVV